MIPHYGKLIHRLKNRMTQKMRFRYIITPYVPPPPPPPPVAQQAEK